MFPFVDKNLNDGYIGRLELESFWPWKSLASVREKMILVFVMFVSVAFWVTSEAHAINLPVKFSKESDLDDLIKKTEKEGRDVEKGYQIARRELERAESELSQAEQELKSARGSKEKREKQRVVEEARKSVDRAKDKVSELYDKWQSMLHDSQMLRSKKAVAERNKKNRLVDDADDKSITIVDDQHEKRGIAFDWRASVFLFFGPATHPKWYAVQLIPLYGQYIYFVAGQKEEYMVLGLNGELGVRGSRVGINIGAEVAGRDLDSDNEIDSLFSAYLHPRFFIPLGGGNELAFAPKAGRVALEDYDKKGYKKGYLFGGDIEVLLSDDSARYGLCLSLGWEHNFLGMSYVRFGIGLGGNGR